MVTQKSLWEHAGRYCHDIHKAKLVVINSQTDHLRLRAFLETLNGQPVCILLDCSRTAYAIGPLSICPSVTLVYCGQTVGWIRMPLGTEVGLGPGHAVLEAVTSSQKGHNSPLQFSAHVYCGQTAGWIKMPLGVEIGLSPGDIVLDGDTATPKERGTVAPAPTFRPMSILAKRSPISATVVLLFSIILRNKNCCLMLWKIRLHKHKCFI